MPANPSLDKFECRYCGCRQSKVVSTEVREINFQKRTVTIIIRRRQCRHCKASGQTVEHSYDPKGRGEHEIPPDGALRPAYDAGRAAGAMEVINGILKAGEEINELPSQIHPIGRGRRRFASQPSSTEIAALEALRQKLAKSKQ